MNKRLKELMLEAGYAAPELAGRANLLATLLVKECAAICKSRNLTPSTFTAEELLEHFEVDNS
jgi:hypothetical protein